LLSILKTLESKEFQDKLRTVSPNTEFDIPVSVLYALENGSTSYYACLHAKHMRKSSETETECKNDDIDDEGKIKFYNI